MAILIAASMRAAERKLPWGGYSPPKDEGRPWGSLLSLTGNFPLELNGQKIILAAWFLLWEKAARVPGPSELGDVLTGLMRQSICWQADHSALPLLPVHPHSSSTPFPQDAEALHILPSSEPSVSLTFQNFLLQGLTPTTTHAQLNNLSRLTLQLGWGVLIVNAL